MEAGEKEMAKQMTECWARALGLLAAGQAVGPRPGVRAFSAALYACGRMDLWEWALALLGELRHLCGILPDTIACNAAMSACERSAQDLAVHGLLETMRIDALEPDVVT